jgi:hypothetical protein
LWWRDGGQQRAKFVIPSWGQAQPARNTSKLIWAGFAEHLVSALPSLFVHLRSQRREDRDRVFDGRTVRLAQTV